MPISEQLIKALYSKYAPDKNPEAQVAYVNDTYTSQDKFVEDFYKEYGAELTLEKKLFIRNNFGGFDNLTPPDVDVEDYASQLAISPEAAQFAALGLSDKQLQDIEEKFSSVDYFDETYEDTTMQVMSGGLAPEPELKSVMYRDLDITKDDHNTNVDNEYKKLIDPHAYNLTDDQIEEINAIRRKLQKQGLSGEELNNALITIAKERILSQYKQQYQYNLIRKKINKYISDNEGYFGTLEDLRKEGKVTKEAGFNEMEIEGPGGYISDDPMEFALQGNRGLFTLSEVALDQREVPDRVKMLKEQSIIFQDIKRFSEVSEKILEDYKKNQVLGEEILAYRESATKPDFEYDAEVALEMEKKLSLYKANEKAILEVIPKIQLASKNISSLSVAGDLLGKNYDLVKKNLANTALGFGDLGLGSLRILSGLSNVLPPMAAWAKERAEMMDNLSLEWDNYKTGVKNYYKPDIKFEDAFEDGFNSFGEFAAQEVSTQIPIFTTMIASGGIAGWAARGLGVTGLSTTNLLGRTVRTLPIIEATGAGTFIGGASGGQQYNTMTAQEMMNPFLEYSEAEKFLVSAGYGAAEGIFGTAPSYLLLRNTAGLFTKGSVNQIAKDGMRKFFAQNIAFPVVAEPMSEGLTQVTQNMLLGRPIMENVDHAMFSGLMFSVVMNAAPAIAGRMMQDFSSITEMKGFMKLEQEMNAIDKALNRKNSKFKKGTPEYNSLVDSYNNLKDQAEAMMGDKYYNITKTGTKAFADFYKNTTRQANIRNRAQKIVDEGGIFLSAEDVNALNALQKEFDQLQRSREIFLSLENFGSEFGNLLGQNEKLYDSYIKKAKQNLKLEGITEPSTVKTFKEASALYAADMFDLYTKNAKKNQLVNMKVFETNQELVEFIDSDPKRKAEFDKKMKRWYIEKGNFVYKTDTFRNALLRGSINGMNTTINGKRFELISKENSLLNERAGTGYHEISHSILFEALAANPEQYIKIAEDILDYLKKSDKKLYNTMIKSGGTQQANIYNPEEIVVNFLERVAEGKIKDPKVIGVMSKGLAKASGIDIDFKSDLDTIKFLYDLGQKIKDGVFKRSDLKSIKLNLRGKLNEADTNVKNINKTKFSEKVNKKDADIIQGLYNNLGPAAAKQISENKYIKKYIKEVLEKYKGVPGYGQLKQDFEIALVNDPVYGILGSLLTYDPKKHPVLAARIIFNIEQRSKTLAERIFPQHFSGEPKDPGYDPTDPEVLNQRESLRLTLGLTPEVIAKVKQAVIKTFGTRLPKVGSKKFKKALQKAFRTELKTLINNYIGTTSETVKIDDDTSVQINPYELLLDEYFELIYGVISQGNINKRFEQFKEEVIDPKKGKRARESTAQGNTIFIKRDITKQEWINYFLGDDVKASTKGTRKTALAESLAEEIAFDATLDVLRDEDILDKVQQIVELQGEVFPENYLAQVAKEINRASGFKWSDSSAGITVLDFDDTVAVSRSMVIVEMEDKTKKELTPAEFAKQHDALKKQGAKFDFSQFNKVIGGEKGPLFGRLQKAVNKFGNKNVFILTARPQEAAPAIKAWLKSQGIALSEKNIVGLSDGSPEAKANWILGKAQEGFNNFYFADDVLENTYAVEQVLSQVDVKYRVDQSITKYSEDNYMPYLESMLDLDTVGDQVWASMKENNPLLYNRTKNKRGEIEELFIATKLEGILGDKIKIKNKAKLEKLKANTKDADIQTILGEYDVNFEIKRLPIDRMGSKAGYTEMLKFYGKDTLNEIINIQQEFNNQIISILDKYKVPYTINTKGLGKNKKFTQGYTEITYRVEDLIKATKGKFNRIGRKNGLLKANGLNLSDTQKDILLPTTKPIVDLYTNKGSHYIIIQGKIYSLDTNILKLKGVKSLLTMNYDTKLAVTMKDESSIEGGKVRRIFPRGYLYFAEKGTVNQIDINKFPESKTVEEAFTKFSDSNAYIDNQINNIIEQSTTATGKTIKNIVTYSDTKAKVIGDTGFYRNQLKGGMIFRFTADDLKGLTYEIMKGIKGEAGNKAKQFFVDNLHRPYNAGIQALNFETLKLMDDVKALNNKITSVSPKLNKIIEGDVYTNEHAIRIYIWKKQGMDIPGIPKQDIADMVNHVKSDLNMVAYAEGLIKISGNKGYPAPNRNWEAGTIKLDFTDDLNTRRRADHLKEWENNVSIMFSKKNLNKMRVAYGNKFVQQLENMLERMRTGKNRTGQNEIMRGWEEWVNGSVGTIMFYNMRSALLQTISMANYINWHDNNMLNAAKAFANQKQYWKDFLYIFNSDYLKVRRGGLQLNINENELAETARKGGIKGLFALLLKNGFTPTRIADSIAIATGGATMYRNRINSNIKKGMSQKEAEARAFEDFMEVTEESQQSSRPDKISAQQASGAGRVLLAFANTPMQYNRMIKRAAQDLYYNRGDWRSNVSKIVYYSTIQNFIFNALQKGIYALGFGLYDDDPVKQKEKTTNVFEGMADSLLSGFGIQGKVAISAKAFLKDALKEERGFYDVNWDNILELSPPFGSKIRKMMSADYLLKKYDNSKQAQEMSIRNPYLMAYAQYGSALFNLPIDRLLRKAHNLQSALADDTAKWQSAALVLGWNEWDVGIEGMERFSEFGLDPIKTDQYLKEREETKEDHKAKIDSIEKLGYKRIPLSGPKSFEPEGKLNVDYIRLKRKLDGRYEYFVPQEIWNKKFPPPPPRTTKDVIEEAKERLRKKGLTL